MGIRTERARIKAEQGFTILEALITILLSTLVFAGVLVQYSGAVSANYDQTIRMEANLQAQAILQTIGSELRTLGNGVPFEQANFQIGESTLSDVTVTYPIDIATATTTNITFRLNETGEVYLLTNTFDPATNLTLSLTTVENLDVNDPVYISNGVVSGDDGLYGIIEAVDSGANTVTIAAGYVVSPGATFDMGSTLEEVPLVTFTTVAGTGITRDSGFGSIQMGAGSALTLEYLDIDGNTIALPLTETALMDSLRAIKVTVTLTSPKQLKSGSPYVATAEQTFGLRNLAYVF